MRALKWFKNLKLKALVNSLVIFEHEYDKNSSLARTSDRYRLTHLFDVLKVKVGDQIKVTVLNQGIGQATIKQFSNDSLELVISEPLKTNSFPQWHLLVGLSRPPTMKKILEHATSLGVTHFHFLPAAMSEKSYQSSKIWEADSVQKFLIDGLMQSARYYQMPQIHHYKNWHEIPTFENYDRRILSLAPDTAPMKPIDAKQPLVLALGPERGFTKQEDENLRQKGFKPISIAPSVLRVEIATFAALGQCHFLLR